MFRKKEKHCSDCGFSVYHHSEQILACGYTCYLNPFKPVVMGLRGICSYRKENKQEQYPKKILK